MRYFELINHEDISFEKWSNLSCQDKKIVKKIFLVHGEAEAKISFKEKLMKEGYKEVIIPHKSETFLLK